MVRRDFPISKCRVCNEANSTASESPDLRANARTYLLAMPKRKLGPLKNLANFANPNIARTTASRLKNVLTKAKGKENKAMVLPGKILDLYVYFHLIVL